MAAAIAIAIAMISQQPEETDCSATHVTLLLLVDAHFLAIQPRVLLA